jgi:hypothetical protein
LRIIVSLDVPAIRRNLDNGFATFDEKLPKGIGAVYTSRETATDSNNRDTFFLHNRQLFCRGGLISVV